jgi:DUF4097 and DUF4098 domain-containing protein YvlB
MIDERPTVSPDPGVDRVDPRRPVRGRALWVIFGSLLLVGGLWWGTFNVVELIAHEERTERFTVDAASLDRLVVENDTGSVTIVGTDTDEISVEAEVSDGLRHTGFRREVVFSTLELHGSCPVFGSMWCRVTYRIEVPRDLTIDIDSDDGRVGVSDVDGDLTIQSDNGAIELSGSTGTISVDSDNGRISGSNLRSPVTDARSNNGRIELSYSEPPDMVTANGDNGSIEVVVPEIDGGYDVTADSSNGGVDPFIHDNPESPHQIRLSTDNGSITVRSEG